MIQRRCLCCKELFTPRHNVRNQKYCGKEQCRRARRALWQREKLKSDPDYREYQAKARKKWREANPGYMRKYRKNNREYRKKERIRSTSVRLLKGTAVVETDKTIPLGRVVNMDSSGAQRFEKTGYYKLCPLSGDGVVNMDSYIVQLTVIEQDTVSVGSS